MVNVLEGGEVEEDKVYGEREERGREGVGEEKGGLGE